MKSIRRELLSWLLGALGCGALVLGGGYYAFVLDEVNEFLDRELKQVALTAQAHHQDDEVLRTRSAPAVPGARKFAYVTQVWSANGKQLFSSAASPAIPLFPAAGFHTLARGDERWRVYTIESSTALIQAAQSLVARRALATELVGKLLFPGLAAVPIIACLLAYALNKGLNPLAGATMAVERQSILSLAPIPATSLPIELHPLVRAVNGLMTRLSSVLSQQREFTADAAHGLRTPLAALRLQFQLLEPSIDTTVHGDLLRDIHACLERVSRLVAQLLELARIEAASNGQMRRDLDLAALARTAVGDFSGRAEQARIDLGADAAWPTMVSGDPLQLRILLDNLLDNALRYTPAGGRVDVRVVRDEAAHQVCLEVLDSGPGLKPQDRTRAFERFVRVNCAQGRIETGTGLGLAIAKGVAEQHQATIQMADGLANSSAGKGLLVRVRFRAK